jgi:hypothetical protein
VEEHARRSTSGRKTLTNRLEDTDSRKSSRW